jgi:hypothetical protein
MIKAFSDLIKTEDLAGKIKKTFTDVFYRNEERDAGKTRGRFLLERTLVGVTAAVLVAVPLTLIFWGVSNTLMNSAVAFGQILNSMTALPLATINIISNVIACGFGLAAQVPFILKTSLTPIIKLFTPSEKKSGEATPTTVREKIRSGFLLVAATICALADGVVALSGKPIGIFSILAGIGASLNSFFAGVVNASLSQPVPAAAVPVVEDVEKDSPPGSSTHISRRLSIRPALHVDVTLPTQQELAAIKSHPAHLYRRRQATPTAANVGALERRNSYAVNGGH